MNQQLNCESLLDLSQTIAKELFLDIKYPWEVLPKIKEFIQNLGRSLPKDKFEEIKENVWIAKTASISNSACIEPFTIIDEFAQVRHGAFIRGSVIIGKNSVVGNSTELKNAVLFNSVQVPHFNYVGDSILGHKAHLGAGAIISNVKSDKSNVKVNYENQKIDTNLRKFGAIVGDLAEIGCNSVLNPGTIIGRNSTVYPLSMVRGFLEENHIFKAPDKVVKKVF